MPAFTTFTMPATVPVLHKYVKTASMAATAVAGDGLYAAADYLIRFLHAAVLLALWRVIFAGRGEVAGMDLSTVLTYTLVARAFSEQLQPRSGLEYAMWEGTVVSHFVRPMSIAGQFAAEMAGRWLPGLCLTALPLLLLAPLFGVDPRPATAAAGLLFLPSLLLAISVGLAIDFIFCVLAVALDTGVWLLQHVRLAVGTLLSGAVLPLALLPWNLGEVFAWLPFAAMASAPLRIYTGTGDPLALLLTQAGWSLLLWPLAGTLWRRQRERLAGYGG
jgi:ABC-2 type transport system permease protein